MHAVRSGGATVGWTTGRCHTVNVLVGGRVVQIARGPRGNTCPPYAHTEPYFALSGTRALWVTFANGNTVYQDVFGGVVGRRPWHVEQAMGDTGGGYGDYVTGVARAGGRLFYSVINEDHTSGCDDGLESCERWVDETKSRVMMLAGRGAKKLPSLPAAFRLAGGEHRLAIAVAAQHLKQEMPQQSGEIHVFAVPSLRRVATAHVGAEIRSVGVSDAALAVLTIGRIRRFDATGAALGTTTVPASVREISVAGTRVAYAAGDEIRVLDERNGRVLVSAHARQPLDVSIAGGRVVWAERQGRRTRILALQLPR
ncbi:MAG TPA: hypothetical protein VIU86_09995 [Gaiellaceae bacterium]